MKGDLFLIAGDPGRRGSGKDPLLAVVMARLGLANPRMAYVGAASNDNRLFFLWIAALLKKAGAGPVRLVPLAGRRAEPQRARAILDEAQVIFVSGGDVELGMRLVQASGLDGKLRDLHRDGKPFIGLSAGSIMLARNWVRWMDESDDSTAEVFPCLGLAPLLCDTHAEKEGWAELKVLLRRSGAPCGYGIPAGAALHAAADGSLAALGKPSMRISRKDGEEDGFLVEEWKGSGVPGRGI